MALVNVWRHLIGCTENFVALIGQVDFSNPSPVVQPIQDVIGLAESGRGTVGIINVRIRNHNACRSPGPALLGSKYRSEEHTSELQSLMRISYAVYCLKKKKYKEKQTPSAE